MNFYKRLLLISICIPSFVFSQVGIGTNAPNSSAQLDVTSATKGFLPPRVALTATNSVSPITAPVAGLLVYNTATAGSSPNNVTPGFYYYDGTKWQRIINQQPDATISFNQNTPTTQGVVFTPNTPASTDYIYVSSTNNSQWTYNGSTYVTYTPPASTAWYLSGGTNDAGSNKTDAIYRTGNMGLGTSSPSARLHTYLANGTNDNELIVQQGSNGKASIFTLRANDNTGASWNSIRSGTSSSEHWSIGGVGNSNTLAIRTAGVDRLRIGSDGNVGVGITSPASILHIDKGTGTASNLQFSAGTTTGQNASDGFSVGIDASGNASIKQQENLAMTFTTNNLERMRIASDGKVGVGTSSPGTQLHIESSLGHGTGLRLVDGSQGPGKILTSDLNGNARWETGSVVVYSEVHAYLASNPSQSFAVNAAFNEFHTTTADNVQTIYGSTYGFQNGTGSGATGDRWVCPRAGKYRITTNAYFNYSSSYSNPRLYAYKYSGTTSTVCNITSANNTSQDIATSTSAIISLGVGDLIYWRVEGTGAQIYCGLYHTFFRIESVE